MKRSLASAFLLCISLCQALDSFAGQITPLFPKGEKPGGLLFFVMTVLAYFLALVMHEAGHLIAGLIQGFRFVLFIIGPIGIWQKENSLSFFLNKNLAYMGGMAATVPVRANDRNKEKFATILLAGPLTSLFCAALAFLIFFFSSSGKGRAFWVLFSVSSLAVFLATTLPKKSGLFFTDRARFQRLRKKGKSADVEEALLEIKAQQMADGSSKNIPLEKAILIQTDDEPFIKFWGFYYAYLYYRDTLNEASAQAMKEKLNELKEAVPGSVWQSLQIGDE